MYLWIERKKKRKVHIQGPQGNSLCLAENGGVKFDGQGEGVPKGRKVCRICLSCQKSGLRDRRPESVAQMSAKAWQDALAALEEIIYEAQVLEEPHGEFLTAIRFGRRVVDKTKGDPDLKKLMGEKI